MNAKHLIILKILKESDIISYNELIKLLNWTRYTISKYIEEINSYFEHSDFNIKIDFQPRIGFSLKGDSKEINEILNLLESTDSVTNDKRIVQVLSLLLDTKGYVTIQDLADEMYISRTTFENTLKDVRKLLEKYEIKIIGSKFGIRLDINEENKRQLIAELINTYKSKLVASSSHKEELKISLSFSEDIKQFIDLETINKVADIVGESITESNLYLTEYEYNSLVIHVSISIDRILKDFVVNQDNKSYDLEKNTEALIIKIQESFEIELPEFEKEYINIYIKSIQQNNYNKSEYNNKKELNNSRQLSNFKELTEKILNDLYPDEELIEDLTLHLKSAINRLKNNISIRNPYLDQIKTKFIQAFETSKRIILYVEEEFDIEFDEDEIAYIAIHIQSFYERNKHNGITDIILVCSSGYGTSKLLEQRLKNIFGQKINIVDTVGINRLKNLDMNNELIITTVPIEDNLKDAVYVSPLLNDKDISNIQKRLTANNYGLSFLELLSEKFFIIDDKELKQNDVIKIMVEDLLEEGFVKSEIYESILNREELSSTAMGNFAMPHAEIKYVNKPVVYIYINRNGILWGEEEVEIVFLFLLNESKKDVIDEIYGYFNDIINSETVLQKIINAKDFEEFTEILMKEV